LLRRESPMLSVVSAALAFNVGSVRLLATPTRASVSMDIATVEKDFCYGKPVPASVAHVGYQLAEMTGKVVPTALPAATTGSPNTLEGTFCYGKPVPASAGLPGFSDAKSFVGADMSTTATPSLPAAAVGNSGSIEGGLVNSRKPASEGLASFSNAKSFFGQ